MSGFIAELSQEINNLHELGVHRRLRPFSGKQGATVTLSQRSLSNFSSNDYLGLASHPDVVAAARDALETAGHGAGAARLLCGSFDQHARLEAALAAFKQAEAALLFTSGYHANVGTLAALLGPEDAVYSDALNHASIVDGCRLSRATIHVYPHADVTRVEALLREGGRYRRRLVVTDAIFGMDGDAAPLAALAELAKRYDAILMVDEAHATGVRGPQGRGLCAELGVEPDVGMGTLGKALGAFGAFISGARELCDYLVQRARTFVFTTALPPAVAAAATRAVEIVASEEGERLRKRLRQNARRFAEGLRRLGLAAPPENAHIFPILLGEAARAQAASAALEARGILALAIRPPTVPQGSARLRFAPTAAHTDEQIDRALEAISHVLR